MHEYYAKEACERCRQHPSDQDEMAPQNVRELVMVEAAYRRGFQQGVEAMYRRWTNNPHGWALVTSIRRRLYKWRFCKHNGRFTVPPKL